MKFGVLHPGAMGASVGAALIAAGHEVLWASEGRGEASRERAASWQDLGSVSAVVAEAHHVVSVCPPDAALDVAEQVASEGLRGRFVDANAVAPATARQIAGLLGPAYVDGGIVGPPAWQPGSTRLFLSGAAANEAAGWFAGSLLEAVVLDGDAVAASGLKMCYAAYTKGSSALLIAVRALADALGVGSALEAEWRASQPALEQRLPATVRGVAPKAWRFEGEMREIAATFEGERLPDGFHLAAAELYGALDQFKDQPDVDVASVLAALKVGTRT